MVDKYTITFYPQNIKCNITNEQTLLDASYKSDIVINAACAGLGTCGLCKVKIINGTYKTETSQLITFEENKNNIVLACKTKPTSNLEVEVLYEEKEKGKILSSIKEASLIKNISPIYKTDNQNNYGIAVDLGTTTIALNLIDLKDGKIIDEEADYNSQNKYGQDIIHRIIYGETEDGLNKLTNAVKTTINSLVHNLITRNNIDEIYLNNYSISGNITMIYLFLGLDPSSIRIVPPAPIGLSFPQHHIKHLSLLGNPNGKIHICPGVANYLGGDIVSGITSIGINNTKNLTLFLDIGTNGEIILGNKDWLMGCACSMGPSFEGMGIKCGMRAAIGAIENIIINKDLSNEYFVIGKTNPKGLCGTALIDITAGLYTNGFIDGKGKFIIDNPRIKTIDGEKSYIIDNTHNIYISEADIDNIIRTKAAIYAGISTLIKKIEIKIKDIDQVIIAGGFGHYLDIQKCQDIGLLPNIQKEKFLFYGNTSLSGARLLMLSSEKREDADEISKKVTYIDLSTENLFMDEFTAASFIPHTN